MSTKFITLFLLLISTAYVQSSLLIGLALLKGFIIGKLLFGGSVGRPIYTTSYYDHGYGKVSLNNEESGVKILIEGGIQ